MYSCICITNAGLTTGRITLYWRNGYIYPLDPAFFERSAHRIKDQHTGSKINSPEKSMYTLEE